MDFRAIEFNECGREIGRGFTQKCVKDVESWFELSDNQIQMDSEYRSGRRSECRNECRK